MRGLVYDWQWDESTEGYKKKADGQWTSLTTLMNMLIDGHLSQQYGNCYTDKTLIVSFISWNWFFSLSRIYRLKSSLTMTQLSPVNTLRISWMTEACSHDFLHWPKMFYHRNQRSNKTTVVRKQCFLAEAVYRATSQHLQHWLICYHVNYGIFWEHTLWRTSSRLRSSIWRCTSLRWAM